MCMEEDRGAVKTEEKQSLTPATVGLRIKSIVRDKTTDTTTGPRSENGKGKSNSKNIKQASLERYEQGHE